MPLPICCYLVIMEKIQFIVEPGDKGFRAWHELAFGGIASTYGETMEALKKNAAESYNVLMHETGGAPISEDDIQFVNHAVD